VTAAQKTATTQPAPRTAASQEEFCFIIVGGRPADLSATTNPAELDNKAEAYLKWFAQQVSQPQALGPFGVTTPTPAFVIHTAASPAGPVRHGLGTKIRKALEGLSVPVHSIPGRDARDRDDASHVPHGSFNAFGSRFIGLSSVERPGPVATLDAGTIYWLRNELATVDTRTPVFLFYPYRPDGPACSQPAEWARLHAAIRRHNVVLLMGGGSGPRHDRLDGFDAITSGAIHGDEAGYAIVSVRDGTVRVAYRYFDADKPVAKLLEKKMRSPQGATLTCSLRPLMPAVRGRQFNLRPKVQPATAKAEYQVSIDDKPVTFKKGRRGELLIPATGLTPGGHTVTVRATTGDGNGFVGMKAGRFYFDDKSIDVAWRRYLPSSVIGAPLPIRRGNLLLVPETSGILRAIHCVQTAQVWEFETGGPIVGSPVHVGGGVFFGSTDGFVYCIDHSGKEVWKYDAGVAVTGSPVVAENTLYIGDRRGRLHAIDAWTGRKNWITEPAGGAIHGAPAVAGGRVWYGTASGAVLCRQAANGTLVSKTVGPSSQAGAAGKPAPILADPVVIGDTLLVCDTTGALGAYKTSGKGFKPLAKGMAAVVAADDGKSVYARGVDRVVKFAADDLAKPVWEAKVPGGRLPVAPTVHAGRVLVCSDTGLLSVLDAANGKVQWQYQVTPGFYVMARVSVDADGHCYPVGMDGTLTRIDGLRKK
jgi:outer membrane protein assembly factor BamB